MSSFSQKWHQYSDSTYFYLKNSNLDKAKYFISLADSAISNSIIEKDTIYGDYLYRKGIAYSSITELKESLKIWEAKSKRSKVKIMKINYFIGINYFTLANNSNSKKDFDSSYYYLNSCYELATKYKFENQTNFKGILFIKAFIEHKYPKEFKNSTKNAQNYINYLKQNPIQDFDFDYLNALEYLREFQKKENLLLDYLKKYEDQKLIDKQLLFNIYKELCLNKIKFKNKESYKFPNDIIKYGLKALQAYNEGQINDTLNLENIYLALYLSYGDIRDKINEDKFYKLSHPDKKINEIENLKELYSAEKLSEFKIQFDSLENEFIRNKDYSSLLKIYTYSLTLFERNLIFNSKDITTQLNRLDFNRENLNLDERIHLDLGIAEYSTFSGNFARALEIANRNLAVKEIYYKLHFYGIKAGCESILGLTVKSYYSAKKTLQIARENYGENHPQILPYLKNIMEINFSLNKITEGLTNSSEILKIIHLNNLDSSESVVELWNALGTVTLRFGNIKDAKRYFENALKVQSKNNSLVKNPYFFIETLLSLATINILEHNYEDAKILLDKAEVYINQSPNLLPIAKQSLYLTFGRYYFYLDHFKEAYKSFKLGLDLAKKDLNNKVDPSYEIFNLMSEYFLNNDPKNIINELEKMKDDRTSKLLYRLKYSLGFNSEAQKILINILQKQIKKLNEYVYLLNTYEKDLIINSLTDEFEFLNSYLLENDQTFLDTYLDLRLFKKSILTPSEYSLNKDLMEDNSLNQEYNFNTNQINNLIENKRSNTLEIEKLKSRNREIEKLSINKNIKNYDLDKNKIYNELTSNNAYVEIVRINKQAKNNPYNSFDIVKKFTDSIYYGAIIIKKNQPPKFVLIDKTNQLESKVVSNFRTNLKNKKIDIDTYRLLFEKIDLELKDIKSIFFVPDGIYNSINIESIYNPKQKKYIIDYLKINLIQNASKINSTQNNINSSIKAVLFGNPDFNLKIVKENNNSFSNVLTRGLDSPTINKIKESVKINSISGTSTEIENISTILKENEYNVEVFSSANASEFNLKRVDSPDILHIATHGFFLKNEDNSKTKKNIADLLNENYKNDSYLKSGLLFAGAQNTLNGDSISTSNNGIFLAEEAKSLNLKNTELVVLSACETGLGGFSISEGVKGLQRAFMIAGAKSVIMSLWEVDDESTQELMTLFYTNWIKNKMSKSDALIKAKLDLKKTKQQPYYWAGFVLLE